MENIEIISLRPLFDFSTGLKVLSAEREPNAGWELIVSKPIEPDSGNAREEISELNDHPQEIRRNIWIVGIASRSAASVFARMFT